jgi:hypothetical protein
MTSPVGCKSNYTCVIVIYYDILVRKTKEMSVEFKIYFKLVVIKIN